MASRPTPKKVPRTPRPITQRTPRPTKAKRTKAPKPTKKPKTSRPTKEPRTKKPRPTRMNDDEEVMAVDVEMELVNNNVDTADTLTGYSAQMEIVGLLSAMTVLIICGYSLMCGRRGKEEKYVAIEDTVV